MEQTIERAGAQPDDERRQPWLHDLVLCLAAPTQVWSGPDGQVRAAGAQGVLHGDCRLLDELVVDVDGREPSPVGHHAASGDAATFVAVARHLGDRRPDPTVRVTRRRQVAPGRLRETYAVTSTAEQRVACRLRVTLRADLTGLDAVKAGGREAPVAPQVDRDDDGPVLRWDGGGLDAVVRAPGADLEVGDDARVRLGWTVEVPPGGSVEHGLEVLLRERAPVSVAPRAAPSWGGLDVVAADRRLAPVLTRCLDDLRLLRLAAADRPGVELGTGEEFVAAGAPWFLTLFGRDSLWTARMLLPVSTDLAGSTLGLLARRQGTRVDHATGEEPGKILHEVRSAGFALGEDGDDGPRGLPPVYYGTIDATPLWVLTLVDAWRWGLADDVVEPLLPALERALAWQVEHGDADGDRLLEYVDHTGRGLANQGWKDSGDAVRHADGALAAAPVALAEVQGYAYAAAVRGADLLERFGRGGTDRWRTWAASLREEFDRRFWVETPLGRFPAIALDREKRPVAALTSNIGHLLGTGVLDDDGVDAVARLLVRDDLRSGFGVRTLSDRATGFSPTGYHVGSVWPHDTAISLAGLAAERRPEAADLADDLLAALHAFDGRPPELFAGDAAADVPVPLPYPAACRPQAWSSAAAVSLVTALLGLRPDEGALAATPVSPWRLGAARVDGLRVGATAWSVEVDEAGRAEVSPR